MIHIDVKAMLFLDGANQISQERVIQLLDRAARPTDQVMMRLFAHNLVVHLPGPAHGMNQADFTQKIQRAIERGAADSRMLPVNAIVNLLGRYVRLSPPHRFQDQLPLRRKTIALRMQVSDEIDSRLSQANLT